MVHGCRFVGKGRVRPRVIRQGISRSAVLYRYVAGLPTDGYQWAWGRSDPHQRRADLRVRQHHTGTYARAAARRRRCWGAGWALVGDAGYFKDPITTHGMTDAMRDAELFADSILDATGGLPEAVALARYQAIRGRLSSRLLAATEDVAAYDWTIERVQTLLRRVSSAMGDEVKHLQARPDRALTGLSQKTWSCS